MRPEDFRWAIESALTQSEPGLWAVCDEYELREDEFYVGEAIVASYPLFNAEGYINEEKWRIYRPLEATPDLFLKFAKLHKAASFKEAALEWSHRHGVPGGFKSAGRLERMPLSGFRREVEVANQVLMLYEAILNGDVEKALSLVHEHTDELLDSGILDHNGEQSIADFEDTMLFAMHMVSRVVAELCDPVLILTEGREPIFSRVRDGWDFDNLLGAMYLQMWWLMSSGDDTTRCEHCGRIISLARPYPEGRKRRSDTRFCDDACRQAHHRSKKQD